MRKRVGFEAQDETRVKYVDDFGRRKLRDEIVN